MLPAKGLVIPVTIQRPNTTRPSTFGDGMTWTMTALWLEKVQSAKAHVQLAQKEICKEGGA